MLRRVANLALLSFAGAVAAGFAAPDAGARTPTSIARQEAESNARTPAGRAYEGVVIGRVEEWLRPALERCVKDAPAEERISFDAFVRVGAVGKPEEVVFAPETAVARCVAAEFLSAKYPTPPQPDWWVKIEVRLK